MAFYPVTPELAKELRSLPGMHAGAWRLWSYLATRDPFGKDYQELPELVDILKECRISKPTFYRAIALFSEHNLFDLQPTKMYFKNLRGQGIVSHMRQENHTRDKKSHGRDSQSHGRESLNSEPAQEASFKNAECTNKRSNKNLKETIGTHTVDPSGLNSGELGTKLDPSNPYEDELRTLLLLATQAGIKTNGTISRTITALRLQRSAADTRQAVENSVSAVVEQVSRGKCKDPSAMLNASLQRELNGQGFTANEAKRNAKGRKVEPSLNEVAGIVNEALAHGDRDRALDHLQELWATGYHNLIEEVLQLFRRNWGFSLTHNGVRDAHET